MKNYYLNVLGLNSDATEKDIKSAYRRLSKKYHPDINNSPNAKDQFLAIKEAYEFLINGSSETIYSNEYSNEPSPEEKWRMEYRRRAKEQEIENHRHQQELIKKIVHYFRPVAVGILIFNLLLAIDFFLPFQNHEQKILGIDKIYEYTRRSTIYRYDEIRFEDFVMRFDRGEVILLDHYEKAIVQSTIIFSKPMVLLFTVDGKEERHRQIYNIYFVFGYIIPVMIALGILFFMLHKPLHRLNVSIVLFVFSLIQLFLYFL